MSLQEVLTTDIDLQTLQALARQGLGWWLDELAALLPASWRRRLATEPPIAAAPRPGGGWRYWRDGKVLADGAPPRQAQRGVELLLSPDAVMTRDLTVPRMSARDLRGMLDFQIDQLSPLRRDLVHFDHRVAQRDIGGGRQTVRLAIARRVDIDRLIEAAVEAGLPVARLGVWSEPGGPASRFDFMPAVRESRGEPTAGRRQGWWWAAVALLLVLNVASLVGRDIADVARLRKAADARIPTVNRVLHLRRRVEAEEARRRDLLASGARSDPLRLLATLTSALPPTVWVQRLEWNGRTVRISGFKPADVDVMAVLRRNGAFENLRGAGSGAPAAVSTGTGQAQPFDVTADVRTEPKR